jgi:hypothetical protein
MVDLGAVDPAHMRRYQNIYTELVIVTTALRHPTANFRDVWYGRMRLCVCGDGCGESHECDGALERY